MAESVSIADNPAGERYVLLLRLYDTAVGVATKAGREGPMPAVTVRSCR